MMRFYVLSSAKKGIKGVAISHSSATNDAGCCGCGGAVLRWMSRRAVVLPAALVVALFLSFVTLRAILLVIESANHDNICSSSSACMRWRYSGEGDASLLREELTRALLEATKSEGKNGNKDGSNSMPRSSYMELVKDMTSSSDEDIKSFAFKTKAMMNQIENTVREAKLRESLYWHVASRPLPKPLHCLTLELAQQFSVNAMARSLLPSPELVPRLTDNSFHHVILLTDNVLAASVAISSTTKASTRPERLVFHVITDKKTHTPMHAWFSENFAAPAVVVEVKALHHYDWPRKAKVKIREMLQIHRLIWRRRRNIFKGQDYGREEEYDKDLAALHPSSVSVLNHLRIYLPELFPDLDRILLLDDDIVVQRDLSPLWDLDLNGKVAGAVTGRVSYRDYFNFSNAMISSAMEPDRHGWLYGVNVFDLRAWRKTNITATYHEWLRRSLISGFELWRPGALPPALIAFEGHVKEIDPSWHLAGLGSRRVAVDEYRLRTAAVLHFSGPAKPWLVIARPDFRSLWYRHVNFSNESVKKCGIVLG